MEVVKFVRLEENGGCINLYFRICDSLADYVRRNTNYCEKKLNLYLSKDNLFCYTLSHDNNFEDIRLSLVDTIERISNEGDDARFYNYLITDDGRHKSPAKIHELMHTEYGLADINEIENADSKDIDLEWWTAHFFISFEQLLFDKADEFIGTDDDTEMIYSVASVPEVSAFLDMLESIDSIIVVDDVREYGSEYRERLHEESE